MNTEFYFIFEVLAFCNAQGAVDWCHENCSWLGQSHVKCIFHQISSNELCPKIQSIISPKERKDMLNYHNKLRDNVATGARIWRVGTENTSGWSFHPSYAGDMRQMVWDYDLEENARIYASQCDVESHEPYDCAGTEETQLVHMNKYDQALPRLQMSQVFKEWVEGGKKPIHLFYNERAIIRMYFPGPWDNFFAIIFSHTYKLGCAKVVCHCNQHKPLYTTGSVACLYGPAPNFSTDGYPIYHISLPCSSCPESTSCKRHSAWLNLCARRDDPTSAEDIPPRDIPPRDCGSQLSSFLVISMIIPSTVYISMEDP